MKNNLEKFAAELSELIGQSIGLNHIHAVTTGRFYYTQAPKPGAPLLLNHYRGPFFVDIHPDDMGRIESGEVSALDYIHSANWQVGYYWGGGDMISGGYYQPLDIIGRNDEVRRYLRILSCRGTMRSSGYRSSEERCQKCFVDSCPFSRFKTGNWNNEIPEHDPRLFFFGALLKRFENEFPGFTLKGFLCDSDIPESEVMLVPNKRYSESDPYSFKVFVSENLIRDLLMREINPENWDEYVMNYMFSIRKSFREETINATSENLQSCFVKETTKVKDEAVPAQKPKGFFSKISARICRH